MVSLADVDAQLAKVGIKNRFFGRPEVKELCHILAPGEVIQHAVNGQYEGGFAMMLATDRRILLIDKKPWFLTMEDIRYDMVSEVDYYARLLDATLSLVTFSKTLRFTSWRQGRLRELVHYIQHRVMELRQVDNTWHQAQQVQTSPQQPQPNMQPQNYVLAQPVQSDFATNYQAHMKRHSLAHVAGKVAMGIQRHKPIVKPLYPRPSLVARYRSSTFAQHQPPGGLTYDAGP